MTVVSDIHYWLLTVVTYPPEQVYTIPDSVWWGCPARAYQTVTAKSLLSITLCLESCQKRCSGDAWMVIDSVVDTLCKNPVWYCGRCTNSVLDQAQSSVVCDCWAGITLFEPQAITEVQSMVPSLLLWWLLTAILDFLVHDVSVPIY